MVDFLNYGTLTSRPKQRGESRKSFSIYYLRSITLQVLDLCTWYLETYICTLYTSCQMNVSHHTSLLMYRYRSGTGSELFDEVEEEEELELDIDETLSEEELEEDELELDKESSSESESELSTSPVMA